MILRNFLDTTTQFYEFENVSEYPTWANALKEERTLCIPKVDAITPEEADHYQRLKTDSVIAAPYYKGATGFIVVRNPKRFVTNLDLLKLSAYIASCEFHDYRLIENAKHQLTASCIKEPNDVWQQTTVLGIIRNEKYKGDLIQGKTFTVDPISYRRLNNQGEVNKYVVKDHHEAIVSEEVWDKAQQILAKRSAYHTNPLVDPKNRTKFSRRYTFSCMIQCGFCSSTLTRRTQNQNSKYKQVVWHCVAATKGGKKKCPECKAIPGSVIEDAFVESFNLITDQHKEILEEFWQRIEETLHDDDLGAVVEKATGELENLEVKKKRLLDMRLEDKIEMEAYLAKDDELNKAIFEKKEELSRIQNVEKTEKELRRHINEMRDYLQNAQPLKEFDCQVFESTVEKVIVGGYDEQGNADPLKITFVYKTGFTDDKDGRDFKHSRRHIGGPKPADFAQHSGDEGQQDAQHVCDEAR